ncbi:FtsX-like permease family protein [Metasolibacillus meyeri]|uniref:FtsX-like permease family protein n=1 Tax=Metasolibacillus meyeri TaxID=1071052 RepID=A0AAW9NVC2_9BACL|nr:FtsX-like permease family protein [Metasolibacillus meyeri]MEC1178253.1 FtsX-like permease family protein [Metasolibacillus meyeri]
MIFRMAQRDIVRNRILTLTLITFIALSSFLMASATTMIVHLFTSVEQFFQQAKAPHFVQMHAGPVNQQQIDAFVLEHSFIEAQQTVDMLTIEQTQFFIESRTQSEAMNSSVMDISFVTQNPLFDFLLDEANQPLQVAQGEIAVPIYYMEKYHLQLGDKIWFTNEQVEKEFTISSFTRDVQMNPSIVSSKRFVIHQEDWHTLAQSIAQHEYLIEFLVTEQAHIQQLEQLYQASNLPQQGPTVTYPLFKMLNMLTDGLNVLIVLFLSIFLMIVALLCIRLTVMTTLEEEIREIAVMKGIGIANKQIRLLYLGKYIAITALAGISGYLLSLLIIQYFTANMGRYLGQFHMTASHYLLSLGSVVIICLISILYCYFILKRCERVSVVEAFRQGAVPEKTITIANSKLPSINLLLGIKDIVARFPMYRLIGAVFIIACFMMLVPLNLLQTVKSPDFITYMGASKSDIRIDLPYNDNTRRQFDSIQTTLAQDGDIEKYALFTTAKFMVETVDGQYDSIQVEIGDFTAFPLRYVEGGAPTQKNTIALSVLQARELAMNVGDSLTIVVDSVAKQLTVSGIYQDITNGGKTAKAQLAINSATPILWYVISVNVVDGVATQEKIEAYRDLFTTAKVTNMTHYITQTLGSNIAQLKQITLLAIMMSLSIAVCITAMFINMLLAKDARQIAILQSLGFSKQAIRTQYMTSAITLLIIAIILGTILSNTVGQYLINKLAMLIGASHITLISHPLQAYFFYPLLFICAVTWTVLSRINRL